MAFRTNKTPVLQTKSASGAVATFNTALAKPLVSCNIAVNAWQEGSGDPSPSNVRPIHGFSEVNATRCGVNLWDEETIIQGSNLQSKNFIPVFPNTRLFFCMPSDLYNGQGLTVSQYDNNKSLTSTMVMNSRNYGASQTMLLSNNTRYIKINVGSTYGTTYNNDISINYPSTDTNYHAYTGNIYTIQLGQEVYGAEVDVVNGVAHCTHYGMTLDGTENINRNTTYHYLTIPCPYNHKQNDSTGCISSHYIFGGSNKPRLTMGNIATVIWFFPEEDSPYYDNAEAFKSYLAQEYANGTPVQIVYPIVTPFDIQLTPTQIETLIGNNTIFADTGDIDLTYKDLDIAKRGNFREVFKLPS